MSAEPSPYTTIIESMSAIMRMPHSLKLHEKFEEAAGVKLDRPGFIALKKISMGGPVRVSDLSQRMGLDVSTISRKVHQLEAEGLVGRSGDPADRRSAVLSITDDGRRVLEKLDGQGEQMLADTMADWPEEDVARLAELLSRLIDDIHRSLELPAAASPKECA